MVRRLTWIIALLTVLVCLLLLYILILQNQFKSIRKQLDRRLTQNTNQPVTLELVSKDLSRLAASINNCLMQERQIRLDSMKDEKHFKEMIANISHDLRTPLTAIKGYLYLLSQSELTSDQCHKLSIAQKHANDLGNLIDSFFDYSYMLNTELLPNMQKINLTNIVAECLADFVTAFEERGITVVYQQELPVYAYADPQMTIRIMQNLLRNCKAYSVGDITVTICNIQSPKGRMAQIAISNAINSNNQVDPERMFERFYKGDKSRSSTATGLGLSIVKHLVEINNGTASARIKENILTLEISLPGVSD